ncbi:MAG: hypothetical protein U9R15_07390 [Chloroflexota bacterium]|nr:hypothetical protein [Chloroflexota bacterium]
MRLFYELVKLSFRLQFTYRAANLAGLATNFIFGLLRAAVLVALYDARIVEHHEQPGREGLDGTRLWGRGF